MRKVLALLYLAAVPALAAAALYLGQLRCEGFGCTGVGVAWVAWVMAYVPVLGLGAVLVSGTAAPGPLPRLAKAALWLQLAVGLAAAALWVVMRLR